MNKMLKFIKENNLNIYDKVEEYYQKLDEVNKSFGIENSFSDNSFSFTENNITWKISPFKTPVVEKTISKISHCTYNCLGHFYCLFVSDDDCFKVHGLSKKRELFNRFYWKDILLI